MEFKELQKAMSVSWARYRKKHGIEEPVKRDDTVMKLGEEYGEFVQAYLISKGYSKKSKRLPKDEAEKKVAAELVDVIAAAILTAEVFGIDVEEGLIRDWVEAS